MKFNVSSQELLQHLNKSAGAISTNPVLPVLEDFLFSISGSKLTVTASNLETTVVNQMDITAEEEGIMAIPAKILLDTLKGLPDQPITITADEDTKGIEITSAYGKYKLSGDNPDDYPEVQKVDEGESIALDASILSNALAKSLFATSSDDLRAAMTGVYFQIDFNKITFVATDAHKLVKYTYGGIKTENTGTYIVPKKALTLLRGILPSDGEVEIRHNNTNVSFSFGDSEIICRLIDANYPDYNAVIPTENPNLLTVSRTEFLSSLRRIAIYANKTTNQVILNLSEGSLTLSAQDLDFSNEATEQLACQYAGDPVVIGFNGRFLIEMLGVMDTDQVLFKLSTPNKAGVMVPSEMDEKEDLMMLVMPVMMGG